VTDPLRIGVMGAGSIGCYLGGRLQAAGIDTVLVGRPALRDEVAAHGLRVTDYTGYDRTLRPDQVTFATEPSALRGARVVLVTVKVVATESAGREIAPYLDPSAVVVSFQNGVRNADILRAALPKNRVLAGMVPFNVLRKEGAAFHRGTSGSLVVEATADRVERDLVLALTTAGAHTVAMRNVLEVQWGKLLLNLNNAINALSGVPLLDQVSNRAYRRVMSAVVSEGVSLLRAARIRPVMNVPLPAFALPWLLRLPDALFTRVAKKLMDIDPEARSSMWEDLDRGRATEIDFLNGEMVDLARKLGRRAPVNERVVELVRKAERAKSGSPRLGADALARELALT
jgi:2-dehydropantoate 2-reductase